jgi:hypothetical protein
MENGDRLDRYYSGAFADTKRRTARLKDEKIANLEDTIDDLKHRMADQLIEIERLTAKYNEEHNLRTKRRGWLDWMMGYIG